ncbi:cytochrome b/b6 domain-containing protein [Alisedimentitalea sp. MJ-SS2]|uniref:cytochrome b/b6 domain-containing protein n=1 Tax=Aliisedimentitalea sp. MJ-SS2 TaxID=3049795 RepID=UPI00290C8515|nr:cytochrome b/b6 domain-containing protein [Alisedimentitalea sp. MJ-SS2]MDU8926895.1 cytochrome b/b6 domain-containing protein [Alisedimentitalea sp. MJ-SS2]
MTKRIVKVYPRFERFSHWSRVALILTLMVTGFGLNGLHGMIPFGTAVTVLTIAALPLLALWVFSTFWLVTTGTWRQFTPTLQGMMHVVVYYAVGVFQGKKHPYQKQLWRKHNPLQAATYFVLKWLIFPSIWITGLLYLTYSFWASAMADSTFWIWLIGNLHVLVAYVIVVFVIIHLYLLTGGGHGVGAHIKPMITGFDEVDLIVKEEAYLQADKPWRLKG